MLVVDFHKSGGEIAIDPHESCARRRQCQFTDESSGGLIHECRMLFLAWQRSPLATRVLSEKSPQALSVHQSREAIATPRNLTYKGSEFSGSVNAGLIVGSAFQRHKVVQRRVSP
jgi:hypothetical protein